jgi:hypothetical protein
MAEKEKSKSMDAKGMIAEHSAKRTKIRYGKRKEVKIVADTTYYKKGQIITPHEIMANQLIKDGIAQEVKG